MSVGLVWLTNPLTMPPIFYFTYRLGACLLNTDARPPIDFHWNLASLQAELAAIWWPLLLGSVLTGIILATLSYFAIQWFWIWHVNRSWRKRRNERAARKRGSGPADQAALSLRPPRAVTGRHGSPAPGPCVAPEPDRGSR